MRHLPLLAVLLALAGCTIQFTPGDAQPASYTPYGRSGGGYGEWWGGDDPRENRPTSLRQ